MEDVEPLLKPLLEGGGTTEEGEPKEEVDPVLKVGGTTDPDNEAAVTGRPFVGLNASPVVGSTGRPVKGSTWSPLLVLVATPGRAPLDDPVDDPELDVGGTTDPVDEAVDDDPPTGRPVAGSNAWPVMGRPVEGSIWNWGAEAPVEGTPFELPKDDPPKELETEADPPAGKVETEAMGTLSGGLFPTLTLSITLLAVGGVKELEDGGELFPTLTLSITLLASTGGVEELDNDPEVKAGEATVVVLAEQQLTVDPSTEELTSAVAEASEPEFVSSSALSKALTWMLRLMFPLPVVSGSRFT
jgi:hypothetical protein